MVHIEDFWLMEELPCVDATAALLFINQTIKPSIPHYYDYHHEEVLIHCYLPNR